MKRELICISCPIGCHIQAEMTAAGEVEVSGNRCPRGKAYALNELTDPKRMVTSVVACASKELPFVPVRSSAPVSIGVFFLTYGTHDVYVRKWNFLCGEIPIDFWS